MNGMNNVIIELKDVSHVYPSRTSPVMALRGINLNISQGEILAIIGQNGSGKTTLAKHLCGILTPTGGTVSVFGIDTKRSNASKICQKIGYVFQNPDHMLFSGSILEEVSFGPKNLGLPESEIMTRTESALKMLGIYDKKDEFPRFLPLIVRVKCAIASVLALDPQVIIFDEPTTGQDHRGAIEILELARNLNEEQGKTIIFVTHDMDIVAKYAHRAVVMSQGQILLEGKPDYIFGKTDILATTYLEPPSIVRLTQMMKDVHFERTPLTVDEFCEEATRLIRDRSGPSKL